MRVWQVDAFTSVPFKGNPAGVVIPEYPLDDSLMQHIATEMNLSETAFFIPGKCPLLRWFTPSYEIDLCGHATLSAAHIWMTKIDPELKHVTFDTKFAGPLEVQRLSNLYTLNFPSRPGKPFEVPSLVIEALGGTKPAEAYLARDLMIVYDDEESVHKMEPDMRALLKFKPSIIATAKSKGPYDFISRFFCADDSITEDPVTGSAHCTLAPYWARKLGKNKLKAHQASKRGGDLLLEVQGERIAIAGEAVTVLEGNILCKF